MLLLAGCVPEESGFLPEASNDFVMTTVGVTDAPSAEPSADGSLDAMIFANDRAEVDATDAADGIVRVRVLSPSKGADESGEGTASVGTAGGDEPSEKRIKAQVRRGDRTTYTYDLAAGEVETLPLSDGDGVYAVTVYEQVEGAEYAEIFAAEFEVVLSDASAPFRAKNKYVDWSDGAAAETLAREVCADASDDAERAAAVFEYVSTSVVYDRETAADMPDGYVPSPDATAVELEGTCLDYASLMAAMLRSEGVAARLVVGYAGEVYHAWADVLLDGEWVRYDPTFAASGSETEGILYIARYFY